MWIFNNLKLIDNRAFARRRDVLDEPFLRALHRRMFSRVWSWAGRYRTSERNLGVESHRIGPEMRRIIDDFGSI